VFDPSIAEEVSRPPAGVRRQKANHDDVRALAGGRVGFGRDNILIWARWRWWSPAGALGNLRTPDRADQVSSRVGSSPDRDLARRRIFIDLCDR